MILKNYTSLAGGLTAAFLAVSTANSADDDQLTIVITGSRTAQTVDEALAPVTVIDRKQIEARPNDSVTDLLRLVPGLSVVSNGGKGAQTSIFLRGTESDQTLILIDGVRMGSATTGTAALQNIPPDQIERIEIVRGPRSSLYGSEAIGGVIQLFTRRPDGDNTRANFSVSGGTQSSAGINAGLSGRKNTAWYTANVSSYKTDGINACNGKPFPNGGGCFTYEPDKDGYKNDSVSLSGGVQLGSRVNASLNALYIDSEVEYDGDFSNERESIDQLLSGKLEVAASDIWSVDLLLAKTEDHSDNFKDGTFTSRFDTDRNQFTFQNNILAGGNGVVTLGLDYYKDEVSGATDYAVDSRDDTGLFGQYLGNFGATDIQLSLRGDDNEQFGNYTTGGASIGRDFAGNLRWTASYGTAFKAPNFNELYFPGFGNPNLSAETSESFDLGLSGRNGNLNLNFSANVFITNIDDLIAYDVVANRPANIGEARISGLELQAGTSFSGWNIDASYTALSPENTGGGIFDGNDLARRPESNFDLIFGRTFGKLSTLFDIHAQGHSYDDLANTVRLAGFTTVDLNLGYAVSSNWMVNLALNNLLDKQYETAKYYNQLGFNALLTLRYTPK
jgi:vitamin B12 transporter